MSIKSRFGRIFTGTGATIGIGVGFVACFIFYGKYMSYKAQIHPTREIAEATLQLDKRISNYCGKNYKIKKYEWVTENEDSVRYRIKLEGIRGKCKVLVKCDKYKHGQLKRISEEQKEYAHKSKEEKAISTFNPFNFNDVLIPTGNTARKINSLQNNNQPIDDEDTFYSLSSVVMVANDSLVFNIRPIGPKYRNYNVEETIYTNTTYADVIDRIDKMKQKYTEALNADISTEEFRNEIILNKHTKYQDMMRTRKFILIGNMVVVIMLSFSYRLIAKNTIDVTTLKSIQNKLTQLNSKHTSTNRLLCISYYYRFLKKDFYIDGLIMNDKGELLKLHTTAEDGSDLPHTDLKIGPIHSSIK